MEQFELDLGVPEEPSKLNANPMVQAFGFGPDKKKCKHCQHLFHKQFANKYWKCSLRVNTNGPSTDQRVNWSACSKFIGTDEE